LLIPLAFIMAQKTRMPLLQIGIPLVSGLSVMHGLVPPHPGPMVAVEVLKADVGKTILYSVLVGIPTAIIAGPLLGNFLARHVPLQASGTLMAQFTGSRGGAGGPPRRVLASNFPPNHFGGGGPRPPTAHQHAEPSPSPPPEERAGERRPGFAITIFTILLPVLLMLLATAVNLAFPDRHAFRQGVDFIGHPIVALLLAVLFSFYSLGYKCGFDRQQILRFTNDCLAPIGGVILVIGAGGGFKEVLVGSGVGAAIAEWASHWHLSPLFFGWLVAALIRVAIGSATVAITTAVGIVMPVASGVPGVNLELVVVAMGAGSLILSHVNDGGFWLVKEYFNMSVTQTLKTWTVMETIISIVALVFTLLLNAMLS
jgi:GntP family gluconate:H+ symporter